jgi:hypothetical protein
VSSSRQEPGTTPPVPVLLAGAGIAVVLGWLLLRSFTTSAARECAALYHAAGTAVDTARIDTTITGAARRQRDPPTCGSYRIGNRWQ